LDETSASASASDRENNEDGARTRKGRMGRLLPRGLVDILSIIVLAMACIIMIATRATRRRRPIENSHTRTSNNTTRSSSSTTISLDITLDPTIAPTATPSVRARQEKRRFVAPEQSIGPEPNEYMDEISYLAERANRLRNELADAMEESGPVWVQTTGDDSTEKRRRFMLAKARRQFKDTIVFDELEFEDGIYGNELSREERDDYPYGDPYYAFDDDIVRTTGKESYLEGCRRTSASRLHRPSCNKIHENDAYTNLMDETSKMLGSGYFRDGFLIRASPLEHDALADDEKGITSAVFKSMSIVDDDGTYDYRMVAQTEMSRIDALVMDLLSHSPHISDIYAYCGLAVITEYCPDEVQSTIVLEEWDDGEHDAADDDEAESRNNFSVAEKLQLALDFAKPLGDMHDRSHYGVMIHVDVKPDQYQRGIDGTLKLLDFNRANFLLYNEEEGEYCSQNEGGAYTIYRSPEEIAAKPQDDKADVYNYASMVYSVLTGLWVHSGYDHEVVRENLLNGRKPFFDRRFVYNSYGEATLVRILDECWEFNPEDRADIFWVIDLLEEAIEKNAEFEAKGITGDKWKEYLANMQNIEDAEGDEDEVEDEVEGKEEDSGDHEYMHDYDYGYDEEKMSTSNSQEDDDHLSGHRSKL